MVLMGRDLSPIADATVTAGRARSRIRENFTIATVYNVLAVPLAVAGLATPLIAALAMSLFVDYRFVERFAPEMSPVWMSLVY
jgi:Cu2+-exporting ATPase